MSTGGPVQDDADAILQQAARPERLWPIAVAVLVLYLASSLWTFERPLGGTGRIAVLHATPTIWMPLLILAVVVGSRIAGHAEVEAGGSPWRWPRVARRTLIGLAVALPLISFAVAPVATVLEVDQGGVDVGPPLTLVVDVGIDVR